MFQYFRIWIQLLLLLGSVELILALFIQTDSVSSSVNTHNHVSAKQGDSQVKEPHPLYYYSIYNETLKARNKNKPVNRGQEIFQRSVIEFPLIPAQNDEIMHVNFPGLYSQEVILFRLAASGLPDSDLSWSGKAADPFVQIYYSNESKPDGFENFARTTTLTDANEPEWQETLKFENYLRGTGQKWRFELRDNDEVDFDDHIGFAVVDIDECVLQSRLTKLRAPSACTAQITNGNGVLYVEIL